MESHRDLEQNLFFGHEFIEFFFVKFSRYIVRSLLNVSETGLVAMVPHAFDTRLKDLVPIFTKSPARFVFVFQRVAVFVSDRVKTEHRLLGTPSAKTKLALSQSVVFFRLPSAGKEGYVFPLLAL